MFKNLVTDKEDAAEKRKKTERKRTRGFRPSKRKYVVTEMSLEGNGHWLLMSHLFVVSGGLQPGWLGRLSASM